MVPGRRGGVNTYGGYTSPSIARLQRLVTLKMKSGDGEARPGQRRAKTGRPTLPKDNAGEGSRLGRPPHAQADKLGEEEKIWSRG